MELFAHQDIGAAWLASRKVALLADEQGLGKTATAITAADTVGAQRILVVCPAVVLHNWKREFGMWSPGRTTWLLAAGKSRVPNDDGVFITTHDLLRSPLFARLCTWWWDLVIVDEAHGFRNRAAARTRRLFGLTPDRFAPAVARSAARTWLLTGTPAPNNPTELWSYLAGLAPERMIPARGGRPMSWHQWRARYCELARVPYGDGVKITGAKNTEELRDRLRGFMLRRTKAEHLQLPPVRWGTVELTAQRNAELTRLDEKMRAALVRAGGALQALRDEVEFSTWRRLCGEAKAKVAADLLIDELLEDPTKKIVVFAHHRAVIEQLRGAFRDAGIGNCAVIGEMDAATRAAEVQKFQTLGDVRVCVCNLVAGGVGITLTAAHDVVFVEQSYVPGENMQAADRVHRIGQTQSVLVRVFTLAGSVDSHVADALAVKREMIQEIMR